MRTLALCAVVLLVVVMAGCGGGGSTPTSQTHGTVEGTLSAADASNYDLILDGQKLDAAPDASGHFSIPNLPAGNHSLTVAGNTGFMGAHVSFVIDSDGGLVDVGDIVPRAGGQIVGLVSKADDFGNLTPLEGVEVLADTEVIYYEDGKPTTGARSKQDGETVQLRAVTDSNGSYVIPAVPEGSYVVSVSVPGLVQGVNWVYVSPGTTAAADFQLLEAIEEGVGTVTGTILGVNENSEEAPLEGATVTIYSDGAWTPSQPEPLPLPVAALAKALLPKSADACLPPDYSFEQFTTLTDAAGKYTLNVPSGHLSLSAWAEGYDCIGDSITLHPKETVSRDYKLTVFTNVEPPIEVQPLKKK